MFKRLTFVTLFFLVMTCIFTYPFVLKINHSIAGSLTTDEPYIALWHSWWLKYAHIHNLNPNLYTYICSPFGFDTGRRTLYPLWTFVYKWLSILTNPFISFNIQILLSFILSGITMYLLVFYLTAKTIPSLFGALIYTFCPYHFSRAWQHLGLAQIQWMPLYIVTLIKLKEQPTYKNMFFCALSIALVISFEFHYAYYMYMVTVLFLLYYLCLSSKRDARFLLFLRQVSIVMLIGILIILPTSAVPAIKEVFSKKEGSLPSAWSAVRPFEDLFEQSARPLSYFLPATVHPLLGSFTEKFLGSSLYGVSLTEHTLYLGWTPVILACIAFRKYKNRKLKVKSYKTQVEDKERFSFGFFIFLVIAAWLFSQPPWWKIGPLKIYMPAFFMYKALPMFRAYCRIGIVVMLGVAVLAGIGLDFALERLKHKRIKASLITPLESPVPLQSPFVTGPVPQGKSFITGFTFLCFGLVIFEFWNYPPYKVIDLKRVPSAYIWLQNEPADFTIAEYPLDTNGANPMYLFYQIRHQKKIINSTVPGTYANKVARGITRLSDPYVASVLKWMQVKYVLVHSDDYLKTGLTEEIEELSRIPYSKGLKLIKNFPSEECLCPNINCTEKSGPIDIYEVVANPEEPKVER